MGEDESALLDDDNGFSDDDDDDDDDGENVVVMDKDAVGYCLLFRSLWLFMMLLLQSNIFAAMQSHNQLKCWSVRPPFSAH